MTVLILAFGFLGMAGLQLTALRNNTSAYERSQASMLAYDIIDRMRANRQSALDGNYEIDLDDAPDSTDCRGVTASCTTVQLADFDVSQWKCNLGSWNGDAACIALGITGKLSNGDGAIDFDDRTVTVTIQWEDNRGEDEADDKLTTFEVATEL